MIAPVNDTGITPTPFRANDALPSLTVGTSYSQWPAARLLSARAYDAVRRGGPTTFTPMARPPPSPAVHAIFVAPRSHRPRLPLRVLPDLNQQSVSALTHNDHKEETMTDTTAKHSNARAHHAVGVPAGACTDNGPNC
jgi:hypothetical protein